MNEYFEYGFAQLYQNNNIQNLWNHIFLIQDKEKKSFTNQHIYNIMSKTKESFTFVTF